MRGLLAAAAVLVGLLIPTSAQAWTVRLSVGSSPVEWTSPQRFAKHDLLRVRVFVGGRELFAQDDSDCRSHLYGHGAAVEMNSCGKRLLVRVVALRALRLRIHYYRV